MYYRRERKVNLATEISIKVMKIAKPLNNRSTILDSQTSFQWIHLELRKSGNHN